MDVSYLRKVLKDAIINFYSRIYYERDVAATAYDKTKLHSLKYIFQDSPNVTKWVDEIDRVKIPRVLQASNNNIGHIGVKMFSGICEVIIDEFERGRPLSAIFVDRFVALHSGGPNQPKEHLYLEECAKTSLRHAARELGIYPQVREWATGKLGTLGIKVDLPANSEEIRTR